MMSAAAVIAIRRKRLARRFRDAGATNPKRAVTLATLGERPSWIFDKMVRQGVFVLGTGGRYYMDEGAAEVFFRRQRIWGLTMAAFLVFLFLLLWVSGVLGH